ncbi:cardiolipin synthase [Candidatus Epulonipiscium viviparus]|uniref:cardiolipin synthase n=1 Tax=Candidatus Epulonipiscium viviparus TaxID=420336 RepID=UPI0027380741|nr:cardiolipin synthase [Candidatus Epulopiscium viviparus]
MRLLKTEKYKNTIYNRLFITGIIAIIQVIIFLVLFFRFLEVSVLVGSALYVLSLIFIIYLIGNDEPGAYKVSWIVIIHLLPLLGILLYLLWGEKSSSKKLNEKVNASVEEIKRYLKEDDETNSSLYTENPRAYSTTTYLKAATHYPAFRGTDVKYFSLGEHYFHDMLEELIKAEKFIFLEYFIVSEGYMWGEILSRLKQRAEAGVKVYIMYDDMGCITTLPWQYREELENVHPNIKCGVFNRIKPIVGLVANHRDHRKILVIDGKIGFTGGINLADEYINEVVRFGHWKDTGIRLEGPAVWGLTCLFIEMWNVASDIHLVPSEYKVETAYYENAGFVQPFGDNPLDDVTVGQNVYVDIINQAKENIYIMTPYLILDDITKNALILAIRRGVDVNILTPGIPDKKAVFRITRTNYISLLRAGAKVYEYTEGFLHAKSIVADGTIGMIGTINLDYRSLYLNFECGVYMYNNPAITALEDDKKQTIAVSKRVELEDVELGLGGRAINAILMIFAPFM